MSKKIKVQEWMSLMILVVLYIMFGILSKGVLFSSYNIKNLLEQSMQVMIAGAGVIFVIAMGSIDLSIGGVAAVSATIACVLAEKCGGWIFLPVSLGIGILMGLINGMVVSKRKVSSFMCTLAMSISLRGLLNVFTTDQVILAPAQLSYFNKFSIKILFVLILLLMMGYILEYTRYGMYCKAMGANEQMAISMGIDVNRMRIYAFILSGVMGSFVGIFQLIQQGGASSSMGSFMEMKVMMAIFIGGVMVSGGLGTKMYKLVIGAIIITVIVNGLYLGNVNVDYLSAVEGILLMIVLYMTLKFSKNKS